MFAKKRKFAADARQHSLLNFMTPSKKQKENTDGETNLTPIRPEKENSPPASQSAIEQLSTQPSTPNTPSDRKFKFKWKEQFPFVRYDSGLMFCTVCESANRTNIWTSGCDKMKVDTIRKHTKTNDHQFALSAQNNKITIEQAAVKAAEKERDGVEGIMKNIYYLAQRNEASSAISDLNKLLVHHHVSRFKSITKLDKSLPYEHHESVNEMQQAMAQVVREQLIQDIHQSELFSVMVDESTDVSTEKTLIMYVRYEKEGKTATKFLEVTELNGDECTALNLCDTIIRILEMRNLSVENIACVTTDGASVMTGVRGGVTTLMKERNGHIISVHCIAHRLALASGQAADSDKYLKKYQAMVNAIFKYYHYSPKHSAKLRKIQEIYEMAEKKFKQTFHTRWLSFDGAVEAVIQNYDALVTCLEMDVAENGDPIAHGLLKFVSDYRFLYTSYMLKDVLKTLCILSKNFQKRDLTVSELCTELRSAVASIEGMKSVPGPFLRNFLDSLPEEYTSGQFQFGSEGHKHPIKCSSEMVSTSEKCMQKYLNTLTQNLSERFPDNGIISAFCIFDPSRIPTSEDDLLVYGNTEINKLAEFYGNGNTPLSIHPNNLRAEWSLFRHYMKENCTKSTTFHNLAEKVLNSQTVAGSYPNIRKLVKVCLILPVSSADCERGFSRYNLIKTKPRNRLYTSTVNTLMMLTVDTPKLEDMDNFDFGKSFNVWAAAKARRTGAFNQMK